MKLKEAFSLDDEEAERQLRPLFSNPFESENVPKFNLQKETQPVARPSTAEKETATDVIECPADAPIAHHIGNILFC